MDNEPRTLIQHRRTAQDKKESNFSATVHFFLRDEHFDPRGYDQTMLTIVLSTFLAYLYTRSWEIVAVGFIVWFLLEYAVWILLPVFSRAIKMHVSSLESRDFEPMIDWLLFIFALFFSIAVIEFSIVNNGAGSIVPLDFPSTTAEWVAAVSVILVSLLSCFGPLYYISFGLLQFTIWVAFFAIGSDLQLWIAIRASAATVYFYAWCLNPIAFSFGFNAGLALAAGAFITSLISGLAIV